MSLPHIYFLTPPDFRTLETFPVPDSANVLRTTKTPSAQISYSLSPPNNPELTWAPTNALQQQFAPIKVVAMSQPATQWPSGPLFPPRTLEETLHYLLRNIPFGTIQKILKPYHTITASVLAYAVKQHNITDTDYAETTFPIMFRLVSQKQAFAPHQTPLVISIYEDHKTLSQDVTRIFSIPAKDLIGVRAVFDKVWSHTDAGQKFADFAGNTEAVLKLLKLEASRNSVLVDVQ